MTKFCEHSDDSVFCCCCIAVATILLGVIDFNKEDSLLGGIPKPVFWVAAFFVMFHLIIWMSLQYISITIESTGES